MKERIMGQRERERKKKKKRRKKEGVKRRLMKQNKREINDTQKPKYCTNTHVETLLLHSMRNESFASHDHVSL